MKLITFKPFAFLLNSSANYFSSDNSEELVFSVNKDLSLLEVCIAAVSSQESKGFSFLKNKFSNNILVGRDKSVVADCDQCGPTSLAFQS